MILAFFLSGCDLMNQRHAEVKEVNDDVLAITFPTEVRGTYIFTPDKPVSFCAEPFPDVGMDAIKKLTSDLSATTEGVNASAKLSAEASERIVELAGRSELVLLARELLYRACELNKSGNSQLGQNLYNEVVNLIKTLGESDKLRQQTEYVKELKTSYIDDKSSACIANWLSEDSSNTDKLNNWLSDKNVSLFLFVNGDRYTDLRDRALSNLDIPCQP